ncbi:hypothetical protein EON65_11025 [archaeon]|nr:MAG: hypothetical protein EON65_11025 [archaeon]
MLSMLVGMDVDKEIASLALIRTNNAGIDQAFEYLVEHGDSLEEEVRKKTGKANNKVQKPRYIPLELQKLFSELYALNIQAVSTKGKYPVILQGSSPYLMCMYSIYSVELTSKGFQWQSAEGSVQHDAHELNRLLIDALERSLKRTPIELLCRSLYQGTVCNHVLCTVCQTVSTREEAFYDLNLQVLDCHDVVSSLLQYFKKEVLEGDCAFDCDTCRDLGVGKTVAYRGQSIKHLPPVLTFSCSRFRIDASTQWQRVKLTSRCAYPLVLDMGEWARGDGKGESMMQGEGRGEEALRQGMVWIHAVWKAAYKKAEECALKNGASLGDDNGYKREGNEENNTVDLQLWSEDEVAQFRQAHLGNLDRSTTNQYLLHSMIIHRGSAYSGHYYAYILDYPSHTPSSTLTQNMIDMRAQITKLLADRKTGGSSGNNTFGIAELKYAQGHFFTFKDSLLHTFINIFSAEELKHGEAMKTSKKQKKLQRKNKSGAETFSLALGVLTQGFPSYAQGM